MFCRNLYGRRSGCAWFGGRMSGRLELLARTDLGVVTDLAEDHLGRAGTSFDGTIRSFVEKFGIRVQYLKQSPVDLVPRPLQI